MFILVRMIILFFLLIIWELFNNDFVYDRVSSTFNFSFVFKVFLKDHMGETRWRLISATVGYSTLNLHLSSFNGCF